MNSIYHKCLLKFLLVCLHFVFCFTCSYTQDTIYAREIIDRLSSSEFYGRGYVNKGVDKAAEYISAKFDQLGISKFKESYYQYFNVDVNVFPKTVELEINGSKFIPGKDFLVDPLSCSYYGESEMFYISMKNIASGINIAMLKKKCIGKFLIIDERFDSEESDLNKQKIEERLNFLKYSKEFTSVGTIILTNKKLTWYNADVQLGKVVVLLNTKLTLNTGDIIKLNIDAEFKRNYRTANIIGFIEGKEIPDSFLVITAHYDHLGTLGSDTYFPGANDNASGTAMLLSLAKYFKKNPPKYSIAFFALSAEEMGLLGSVYLTENPVFNLAEIKFLLNLDLAGTGQEGIKVVNGSVYKNHFLRLKDINSKNNFLKDVKMRGEACNSDHCPFYKKGVPSFFIYTLGGIDAYHDIYDISDTLPLNYFESYCNLLIRFISGF